jgi:outer membrane protein TolC
MHPPGMLRFVFLLSLTMVFSPHPSRAIAGPQESVKLDFLVDELLRANPELQASHKRYEAALTRPSQESALPDPRITTGWLGSHKQYWDSVRSGNPFSWETCLERRHRAKGS